MRRVRVIPVLLLRKGGLYKSVRFKNHTYIGDPINAVKIFNQKEVDEIVVLDIEASADSRGPDFKRIGEIAGEAFMPLAYGGGITTLDEIKRLLYEGVEKIIFNSSAVNRPQLIREAASQFGSSTICVSIDFKKDWLGRNHVYTSNGRKRIDEDPVKFAIRMQQLGAGEIFLNSIDRDGTYSGFDVDIIKRVSQNLSIPLVICGGASSIEDFKIAIEAGASAVAAGSMFVLQRPHKAVLISYPKQEDLQQKLYSLIR